MITPNEASARREVFRTGKFTECTAAIDELLCGEPNDVTYGRAAWSYAMPTLRDGGALIRAVAEAYRKAGWDVSNNGNTLQFTVTPVAEQAREVKP